MAKLDQSVVSWPGKEGHSPSRIDFSERLLYEENVELFARAESWQQRSHMLWKSYLNQVDQAGRGQVLQCRKVGPSNRMTLVYHLKIVTG